MESGGAVVRELLVVFDVEERSRRRRSFSSALSLAVSSRSEEVSDSREERWASMVEGSISSY
jgi:hypothetical protein